MRNAEAPWFVQPIAGSGGAALSSALCDSDRARGNGMELRQGRGGWGPGTGAAPQGGGQGTGCTGLWARPQVLEFRERLDRSETQGSNSGWCCVEVTSPQPLI